MPQLLEEKSEETYLRALLPAACIQAELPGRILIQPSYAVVFEVCANGRVFRLNAPISLVRYAENGYIYFESKLFGIVACGQSPQIAADSFQEDFAVLWDEIAQQPDKLLTPEARKVKAELLNVVNAVVAE